MTYKQAAKFYDLFGSKNDLEFYKELALKSGNKALELGVGTARVALSLARAGLTAVWNYRSFLVLSGSQNPASTFDHNVTVEDRKQTLTCVFKHLKKNGTFAFDLEQAAPDKPEKSWWIDRKETEDGKMVVRSIFTRKNTLKRTKP